MSILEDLRARLALLPEERTVLLRATAAALAFPQFCYRRCCRRGRRCDATDAGVGLPACLARLSPGWRAPFNSLFALVETIAEGHDRRAPSPDPDRRDQEAVAIAVVHASLHLMPKSAGNARAWIAHYQNPPPPEPPVDIHLMRARLELERIRAEHILALENIGR